MTEVEQELRRRRARDLERRLRALGFHCPPGTLEPLTQDAHLARSPAAVTSSDSAVAGEVIYTPHGKPLRRYFATEITVR